MVKRRRFGKSFGHWVMVVRENVSAYEQEVLAAPRCGGGREVARLLGPRAASEDVEVIYVVGLDGNGHVRFLSEVARGGMHGCSVDLRSILRLAVMGGASSLVLAHNHPSGDPTPSSEDYAMTRRVKDACETIDVLLVDHVVIAACERFHSMYDHGAIFG